MTSPQTADDYEWPTCTACGNQLWHTEAGRHACRLCEQRTATRLRELPDLYANLNQTALLMRGTTTSNTPTSGSRTPPIPPRLDVLNLTAPGGATRRLQDIEDAWRTALGWKHEPRTDATNLRTFAPWRSNPAADFQRHATFLTNNLGWACERYDSIAQDIEELRRLHAAITAALTGQPRPGRVPVGFCPTPNPDGKPCGTDLTASTTSPRIQCPTCGTRWTSPDDWRQLRDAQQTALANMETAA